MFFLVDNVDRNFGGLKALRGVTLNIEKGEIRALIGPNGSGKTTLFNVISGFLKPSKGKIIFNGEDITGQRPDQIAKKGIVRTFQLVSLLKEETVLINLILGHHLKARLGLFENWLNTPSVQKKEEEILRSSLKILNEIGIEGLKDELVKNLPQGHQRMLQLGMALAVNAELMLLDEPTSGMNPTETAGIVTLIKRIADKGTTIIIVEHNMKVVMELSQIITVLNEGSIIAEGSPKEISVNKYVIEAYLGKSRNPLK